MNSTLKIALPLALVVIVIFGVTLISQNVPDTPTKDDEFSSSSNKLTGPPLIIPSTVLAYNPAAPDIESRSFQGFFELDKTAVPVSFWFKNAHPVPVHVQALYRGCTTCTQARIATVREASFEKFVNQAMLGALPSNPLAGFNLLPALAAAELTTELKWDDFDFDNINKIIDVPAAESPDKPVLGLFQMAISVTSIGPSDKRYVVLRAWPEGATPNDYTFAANMIGVQPFDSLENAIKVPPLDEGAESKTYTIQVLSATRKLPEQYGSKLPFNPPIVTVNPPDPFIEVGPAVALSPEEVQTARNAMMANKKVVPFKCGYSFQVTVHRQRPGQTPSEPDIGPYSRELAISSPGTLHTPTINVSGAFLGLVSLTDGDLIDLKDFPGKVGTTKTVSLVSDLLDAEVTWFAEDTRPSYLDVKLSKPRNENGRRYWDMTVSVPPSRLLTTMPFGSYIALKAKVASGERLIRFPIKGVGFAR